MGVVVQKYGGSSVADLQKIQAVADRVQRTVASGMSVVVVVSAMGNTTNELLALAKEVASTPDPRELDMLISVGERISMSLLALALRARGCAAVSLTGSQSGIITDEVHADARVIEVRPDRVRQLLEQSKVVIIAGFQGVSRTREVTTLGRGGSDTTAVVLAAALNADYCEICSDVDGIWSADPRFVIDAQRLDTLSLDEGLALARAGAKVLFEDAVQYARDAGVELVASVSFGPGAGTRLTIDANASKGPVAVTGDKQLIKARITGRLSESVFSSLRKQGARVRRRVGPLLHLDPRNVHGALRPPAGVELLGPMAVVSMVGSGIGERLDLAAQAEDALSVSPLSSGGSGDVLWFEVPVDQLDRAVRALHARMKAMQLVDLKVVDDEGVGSGLG